MKLSEYRTLRNRANDNDFKQAAGFLPPLEFQEINYRISVLETFAYMRDTAATLEQHEDESLRRDHQERVVGYMRLLEVDHILLTSDSPEQNTQRKTARAYMQTITDAFCRQSNKLSPGDYTKAVSQYLTAYCIAWERYREMLISVVNLKL